MLFRSHSDFGGEVERVLNMADGCILLVDAFEGPMPQTRFVLQKALEIGLKPIVVVNKVDKPNCRPEEVYEMVFDLMFSLNATEDQLDFPVIYGSAKNNWMSTDWKQQTDSITPLLDCIIENIPAPKQLEVLLEHNMILEAIKYLFTHIINEAKLYRKLFETTGQNSFEQVMIEQFTSFFKEHLKIFDTDQIPDNPMLSPLIICKYLDRKSTPLNSSHSV